MKSSPETAAQMLETGEAEADKLYETMIAAAENDSDRQALLEAQREENAHSMMLQEMSRPRVTMHPQSRLDRILGREHWHVTAGGWIGQAIYGVNDGLGAAFGVVSGVAGATSANGQFILLSGLAAAIASALSMGSGAYLASKSEREVYQAELDRERQELEEKPEEEMEELELFYQLKGFSPDEAKKMVRKLAEQPDQLLKTLAHEELGLSEQSFPNPMRSAVSATISTGCRRSCTGAALLFLDRTEGTGYFFNRQHACPFYGRCIESSRHRALVDEERTGNDRCRIGRGNDYVCNRPASCTRVRMMVGISNAKSY